jgi:hypothetical protein
VEHYERRRTKASKNAARTSSKGSKGKQTTVGKIQCYAARQVSVYRQQISQFFPRTRYSTPIGPVKYCLSVPDSGLLEQHAFH